MKTMTSKIHALLSLLTPLPWSPS